MSHSEIRPAELRTREGEQRARSSPRPLRGFPAVYVIGFMVLAVLVGGFIWHDLRAAHRDTLAYWNVRLSGSAEDRVRILELWLRERRTDVEVTAENPLTVQLLAADRAPKESVANARKVMEQKLGGIEAGRGLLAGFIVDRSCTVVARGGSPEVTAADLQSSCQSVFRVRHFDVEGSHLEKDTVWMNLAAPVLVAEPAPAPGSSKRHMAGAVILVFSPWEYMSSFISDESEALRSTETQLVWRDDRRALIFFPRRAVLHQPSLFRRQLDENIFGAQVARTPELPFGEYVNYRGVKILGASKHIPISGGSLARTVEYSEAFSDYRRRALLEGLVGALSVILLGAWLIAQHRRSAMRDLAAKIEQQEALLESEERFRALSDASFEGVAFTDGGTVILANARLPEMLGCSIEELVGSSVSTWISPESREEVMERVRAGSEGTYEHFLLRKDGSRFPVESRARHLNWKSKRVRVTAIRDITERKRAEQMLRDLTEGTASAVGSAFFSSLVRHTAAALGAKYTFVAERIEPGRARTLAFWQGDRQGENFEYELKGSPCQDVLHGTTCFHPENVQVLFPEDEGLAKLGAESYLGVPLFDSSQHVIGHMAVLDSRPMSDDPQATAILDIFAARAGAELERQRALEAVQNEKAFSDAVIGSMPGFVFVIDPKGEVVRWNRNSETILGYSHDELLTFKTIDAIAEEDREVVAEKWLEAFDKGSATCEARALTKEGRKIPFLLSAVRAGIGNDTYIIGTGIDITQRKKAEETLVKLKKAVDTSGEVIFMTDRDGVFTSINPKFTSLYGYTEQEVVGKSTPRILKSGNMKAEDYAAMWKAILEKRVFHAEMENKTKEGKPVTIETSINAIVGDRDEILGFLAIQRDIAERKRAEAALQAEKAFSEALIDSIPGIFYVIDSEGRPVRWNRTTPAGLGYSNHELGSMGPLAYVPAEDRARAASVLKDALQTGAVKTETNLLAKDGTKVPFIFTGVRAVIGEKTYLVGTGIDISDRKRAEEALQAEKAFSEAVIDSLPGGFFVQDPTGRLVRWNRNVEALGYTGQELAGLNAKFLTAEEDREPANAALRKVLDDGSAAIELHIQAKDGSKVPYFISGVRANIGGNAYVVATGLNITERRRAEEALRESERRYRELVDSASDIIYETDRNGRFTFVNPVATRILGYTTQELLGRHYLELVRPDYQVEAERFYRDQRKNRISSTYLQCPAVAKDGTEVWLGQHVRLAFDEKRVHGFGAIARDITRQKRAEAALVESEERFRQMAENSPDLFWLYDVAKQTLLYVSPAFEKLWGRTVQELHARPEIWRDTVHPEDRDRILADFDTVARTVGSQNEFRIIWPDGSIRWVNGRTFPIRDEAGQIRRLAGIAYDVTERKRAEEALRTSQEMFSKAFHSSPEPMGIMQLSDWTFLDANQAACDLIGFSHEQIVGRTGRDLGLTAASKVTDEQLQSLARGEFRDQELELKVKSGEIRTVLVSLEMVEIGGRPCILAQGRDVTEQRRAVNALQASDRRYRDFISHSQEGVWRVELEEPVPLDLPVEEQIERLMKSTYMAECNDAMARIVGLSRAEELVGSRIKDLVPSSDQGRIETYFSAARGKWQNRTVQFEAVDLEGRRKHLQRTEVPIIENGKLTRIWGMTRDVTSLHNAEEALRASEQRYRLLFERSVAGVLETTFDGRLLECNDAFARIQGYTSRDELLAAKAKDFYLERADGTALSDLLVQQPLVMGQEFQTRRKDGLPVWMLVSASLVEHDKAEATILATAFDITQWKELGEQLRQSQKMEAVGRLAGGVAHDFNNMLQIINGYSELVIDQLPADDPSRSHVYEIKSIVDRAAGLTRQLLAFSRQQVLAPQVLDLNAAIANLSKMLRRLIGEDVELILTEGRPLSRVKADPGQVDQVILNLAVNARDAMPQGGRLAISTSNVEIDATYALAHFPMTPGPYVLISVTDTGHGMSAQTQARIFEPFFTTKETGKGTGLGLATVYGIVKQSGGFIWVESEVGKGTTFKIYLPPAAEAPSVRPEISEAAKAHGTETVLLVEDEEYVRSLVRRSLQSKGYTVLEARNGAEALRVAQQHPGSIDLLITDVVMPGMSGRELSEQLVPLRPHLKTIFMSGYTDDSVLHRGILSSGGVLLQKPFTAETLAVKVRQVLESA